MKKDNFSLITPIEVSNSILSRAKKLDVKISPIKLYNFIYLIYCEHLFQTGKKLFNEQFIITNKGPVLTSVFYKFDCYGKNAIITYASNAKGKRFMAEGLDFYIDPVLDKYKGYLDNDIIELTTSKNSAYDICKKSGYLVLTDEEILKEVIKSKEKEIQKVKKYIK